MRRVTELRGSLSAILRGRLLASLRGRLLASLLGLVVIGLLTADVATWGALRSFLYQRVDQQLVAARVPVAEELSLSHPRPLRPSARAVIPTGTYGIFLDPNGRVIRSIVVGSPTEADSSYPEPSLPSDLPAGLNASSQPAFDTGSVRPGATQAGLAGRGSVHYRVLATPVPTGTLVVAIPIVSVDQTLGRLVLIEGLTSAAVVVAVGLAALWLVRLGLRPLTRIEEVAGAIASGNITSGDLTRRVEQAEPSTEVGRLGLALNEMLGQIEGAFAAQQASEERLRRFVADASHELRTPLTSIRGWAELFRQGAAQRPDDLATAMRRIEEESVRMGDLVDDLLLLARLDQGRPLERMPVDLAQLARDAAADARAVEPERPIEVSADGPLVVEGDESRLRQVMANLLANARQHTPPGTRVRVAAFARGGSAVLEVADEGPGLDPEAAGKVFERFYRAEASRSRDHGGAGLGLSIVAAVAEAHGGRARVHSVVGEGADFVVELPGGLPTQAACPG